MLVVSTKPINFRSYIVSEACVGFLFQYVKFLTDSYSDGIHYFNHASFS